jgi:ABC-type branched-subunit amino acid transport system substrate-binding protein
MDQQYAMFLGEDAAAVPEVKLFVDWMKKTHPDQALDLFAAYSWASARLFVQALEAAGQNPTRADLIKALDNIHDFDSNGMVAKADPGNHAPPECWMLVTLKDGKYERTLPSGSGFDCTNTGYFKVS